MSALGELHKVRGKIIRFWVVLKATTTFTGTDTVHHANRNSLLIQLVHVFTEFILASPAETTPICIGG